MPDNTVIRANLQRHNGEACLFEITLHDPSDFVTWWRVRSIRDPRQLRRRDLRRSLDRPQEADTAAITDTQRVATLLDHLGLLPESAPARPAPPSYSNVGTFAWYGATYNFPFARTQATARIVTTNTTNPWAS